MGLALSQMSCDPSHSEINVPEVKKRHMIQVKTLKGLLIPLMFEVLWF
jgi:hypothetical protein